LLRPYRGLQIARTVPEGIELGERIGPTLLAICPHLADCGSQSSPPNKLGELFLPQTLSGTASHYCTRRRISGKTPPDKDS
jgi:hypothetical protein